MSVLAAQEARGEKKGHVTCRMTCWQEPSAKPRQTREISLFQACCLLCVLTANACVGAGVAGLALARVAAGVTAGLLWGAALLAVKCGGPTVVVACTSCEGGQSVLVHGARHSNSRGEPGRRHAQLPSNCPVRQPKAATSSRAGLTSRALALFCNEIVDLVEVCVADDAGAPAARLAAPADALCPRRAAGGRPAHRGGAVGALVGGGIAVRVDHVRTVAAFSLPGGRVGARDCEPGGTPC